MVEIEEAQHVGERKNIDYLNSIFKDDNEAEAFLDNLVTRRFEDFLSTDELKLLAKSSIKDKTLRKVAYIDDYKARHVEAKGVSYVTRVPERRGGKNLT
ncbi:hypothetical protein [Rickettsia helvetica]|uniref:Uncharacterized protein n=1 Tax=Rickettsia helvetica TaxID=35789 RepID=A0ABM9N9Q2_RICHE|nr:hypothetical protein [Rickettsia helvetica]MCZ6884253.1 hypothetical protein [Rickettsia endosymbiont of Ixodes ricinus]MCZ6897007.1 hypothetical protein [Rickettsia endosymbiont of Ixodes ricinus]